MRKEATKKDRKIIKKLDRALIQNHNVITVIDDDGDVLIKTSLIGGMEVVTIVECTYYGYRIDTYFPVGDEDDKSVLLDIVNESNRTTREGSFYLDSDSELHWKSLIPYTDDLKSSDILRIWKLSITTFISISKDIAMTIAGGDQELQTWDEDDEENDGNLIKDIFARFDDRSDKTE